ncbi:DUF1844 domain-containing protein [Thermodesulfobacteriota bacterium]
MEDDRNGQDEKGFTIKDRRRFNEDGESKEGPTGEDSTSGKCACGGEESRSCETKGDGPDESLPMPEINFATFILSLSQSALIHLGEVPDPVTQETEEALPFAKQTIDIMGILKEKTEGNLEKEEENLLSSILYDLRMRYVEKTK